MPRVYKVQVENQMEKSFKTKGWSKDFADLDPPLQPYRGLAWYLLAAVGR